MLPSGSAGITPKISSLFLENNTQTNMSGMHFLPLRFLESASSLSEADITSDILAEIQTYENSHSLNCICGAEGAKKKKLAMFLSSRMLRILRQVFLLSPELLF